MARGLELPLAEDDHLSVAEISKLVSEANADVPTGNKEKPSPTTARA